MLQVESVADIQTVGDITRHHANTVRTVSPSILKGDASPLPNSIAAPIRSLTV